MEVERASDLRSYVQQNGSSSNSSEGSSSVERKGVVVQQHPSRHCSCILLLFLGLSCTRSVQQCGQSLLPAAIAPTLLQQHAALQRAAARGRWLQQQQCTATWQQHQQQQHQRWRDMQ